jgi:hypothetical protein
MIRHIVSLTILLATLIFAGLPAVACAKCVPRDECCPAQAIATCTVAGSATESSGFIEPCGTAGPGGSAIFAASDSSNYFTKHLKRSNVPALALALSIAQVGPIASSRLLLRPFTSSFTPSYALLYLSTGRLRL